MNKKFFSILSFVIPLSLSFSCFANKQNKIVFALSQNQYQKDFLTSIENQFNHLKKNSEFANQNFLFEVKSIDDNEAKKDLIENHSVSFAFLTYFSILSNDFYKSSFPMIQTLTDAFIFDLDSNLNYVDGSENDPLVKIAKNMQNLSFGENYQYPFSSWKTNKNDSLNYDWNGIRYNKFYAKDKKIDFYRGMIVLSNTQENIKKAKKAWNEKNWNDFRNQGIITGNIDSFGNYELQENLIKKHFNLPNDFKLINDKKDHQDKYDIDPYGTQKIGKSKKFTIHFTDEASFAWTNNLKDKNSYTPLEGSVIEILTVTEPTFYDIGVFNKSLDKNLINLLTKSIIFAGDEVKKYGDLLGYNAFKKIDNFQKLFNVKNASFK